MKAKSLDEQLAFVKRATGQDDAAILSVAVRRGVHALYRDALATAYLQGGLGREDLLREVGPEFADRLDREKKAIDEDLEWGLSG